MMSKENQTLRVLVVDDEEDIGQMVCRFLEKSGMMPTYCSRIEMARQMIQKEGHHAYLLDLNLPDGTGFDLVPAIRQRAPQARIFVISAFDGQEEVQRAEELGIDKFIKKPFGKREVIEAIEAGTH